MIEIEESNELPKNSDEAAKPWGEPYPTEPGEQEGKGVGIGGREQSNHGQKAKWTEAGHYEAPEGMEPGTNVRLIDGREIVV